MGWFHETDSSEGVAYNDFQEKKKSGNKASLSHEAIAGAAAYEAAKAYEKHCEDKGQPQSHKEAKELMAGFIGAFIDREIETKGEDEIDKLKQQAHERTAQKLKADGQW